MNAVVGLRSLSRIALSAVTLACWACGGENGGASDTSAPQPRSTPEMPASWTNIGQPAFQTYVNVTLNFGASGGNTGVQRNCRAAEPECSAATVPGKTTVDITPEEGARELDPKLLGANGHIIARLQNTGSATEDKYGLPKGPFVYWLVTPGSTGQPGISHFVYFNGAQKVTLGPFPYSECMDGKTHPNTGREADFSWCKDDTLALRGRNGDQPAWISCLEGCCVAEATKK